MTNDELEEQTKMNLVPTHKQAGVIFKNWKSGNIKMTEKDISNLYITADSMYKTEVYNRNHFYCDNIMRAIYFIFKNDFKKAQKYIDDAIEN